MPNPIKVTRAQFKRLERNLLKKQSAVSHKRSALEVALRKAQSVFDHAGNPSDLWMAKKYIDEALKLLEVK